MSEKYGSHITGLGGEWGVGVPVPESGALGTGPDFEISPVPVPVLQPCYISGLSLANCCPTKQDHTSDRAALRDRGVHAYALHQLF